MTLTHVQNYGSSSKFWASGAKYLKKNSNHINNDELV